MTTDPSMTLGLAEETVRFNRGEPLTLAALRADPALRERRADECIKRCAEEIAAAPSKTIFIFDLLSGDYVRAGSRLDALDAFEAKFGVNRTVGRVHAIDDPIFIGGGLGHG